MRYSVSRVDPLLLLDRWPDIKDLVKRVIARAGHCYRAPDVFDMIHRNQWQLWIAEHDGVHAIAITSIESYPLKRICLIRYVAGDMDALLSNGPVIETWARMEGCSLIKQFGRKGWDRAVKDPLWKATQTVMEKDLTDEGL